MNQFKYFFVLLLLTLVACGKKEVVGTEKIAAQTRALGTFNSMAISGYYNVNITIGQPQSVTIKVNANLLPYIETKVGSKQLTIQSKKGYLLRPQGIPEVDIVAANVDEINLSGNNNAVLTNYKDDTLFLKLAGSNQFEAQGLVNKFSVDLSGNSTINAQKLLATKVIIDSNGNSKIIVAAKDNLKVDIAGNAIVNYVGNPKIEQSISGSGAISKIQETVVK